MVKHEIVKHEEKQNHSIVMALYFFSSVDALMIKYDQAWANLWSSNIKVDRVKSSFNLIQFDQVWYSLFQFDLVWSNLTWFDQIWPGLILFDPVCTCTVKYNQAWSKWSSELWAILIIVGWPYGFANNIQMAVILKINREGLGGGSELLEPCRTRQKFLATQGSS